MIRSRAGPGLGQREARRPVNLPAQHAGPIPTIPCATRDHVLDGVEDPIFHPQTGGVLTTASRLPGAVVLPVGYETRPMPAARQLWVHAPTSLTLPIDPTRTST